MFVVFFIYFFFALNKKRTKFNKDIILTRLLLINSTIIHCEMISNNFLQKVHLICQVVTIAQYIFENYVVYRTLNWYIVFASDFL